MSFIAHKTIALFIVVAIVATAFSPLLGVPHTVSAQTEPPPYWDDMAGPAPAGSGGTTNANADPAAGAAKGAITGAPSLAASCGLTKTTVATGATVASAEAKAVASSVGVLVALPPFLSGLLGGQSAANAQNNFKENCLNAIAWYLAKIIIDEIVQSTVAWINSGFKGSPTFVTDPGQFFVGVADRHAVEFLNDLFPQSQGLTDYLCKPFSFDLEFKLRFKYQYNARFRDKVKCTVSDIAKNIDGFGKSAEESMNDFYNGNFNEGGWDRWFEITQKPANNKYGAQLLIEDQLQGELSARVGQEKMVLDWGSGFHSITDGFNKIITPGTAIEDALADVGGTGIRQLELADEFNEIVGALMGQLMKTAFSSGSGGIAGLSNPNANPNLKGRSFTEALATSSGMNAYNGTGQTAGVPGFGDSGLGDISTSTADKPVKNLSFGKPARQFNAPQGSNYSADKAVNGVTEMKGNNQGISFTDCAISRAPYTYWQVNLEASKNIHEVVIYPDTSTDRGELSNFYVLISEGPFPINAYPPGSEKVTATPQELATQPGVLSFRFPPTGTTNRISNPPIHIPITAFAGRPTNATATTTTGKYVRIQRFEGNTDDRIDVCEVEVMGTDR